MSDRPHRHLCPEADMRDAMSDEDFWAHVFPQQHTWDHEDDGPNLDASLDATPCEECGETGACAYDSEGRALIHATTDESEDA